MNAPMGAEAEQEVQLPVIDIGPLLSGSAAEREAVGDALQRACLDKGFFYVRNHGVAADLQERVFAASRAFFDLPLDTKRQVDKSLSQANRGYEPLRGQTLEAGAPPDLKEGFYIGEDLSPDDPRVLAGEFNQGANLWPAGVPDFREAMMEYFDAMVDLNGVIMHGLALSLDLPEHFFDDFCRDPLATLRLLHYPPQPPQPAPGEKGCGAHTDWGGITVLMLDENPGLQVWDNQKECWINADPIPGTFVVNLGDMIARWTNDRYRSTLHRVVNTSGAERYSVPFFFSGSRDHEVRCLPGCLGPGEEPKYPPTTVEAHLRAMYEKTYG
ncbi:MAG: hypothetical protein LAT50_12200 [Ectothiorhodospiraceae bacterium]|nr:hypothetical protein [Ectothiorhodospiraceae bacterium]